MAFIKPQKAVALKRPIAPPVDKAQQPATTFLTLPEQTHAEVAVGRRATESFQQRHEAELEAGRRAVAEAEARDYARRASQQADEQAEAQPEEEEEEETPSE